MNTIFFLPNRLLNPQCCLLKNLGTRFQFELSVGLNGRVLAKAKSDVATIAMANAILASEYMDNDQIKAMCKRLARAVAGIDMEL